MGEPDPKYFRPDGSQRETSEDGQPVGDFNNPNHPGAEDMPHELSGRPLYVPRKTAAQKSTLGDQWTDHSDGTYTHSSAEHTGRETADANGVDLTPFEDDSMDGM